MVGPPRLPRSVPHTDGLLSPCLLLPRTPAMIGCSFVVDREYFGDIGLLDPGMEVYGGENIELGMRVSVTQPLGPLTGMMHRADLSKVVPGWSVSCLLQIRRR